MFENGWWGRCISTSLLDPPLPARITMSLTTTLTSRFGFCVMCGKFCHSCFEITARTALTQFGHFTLKTKVRFEKGGGSTPQTPPLGAPLDPPNIDDYNYENIMCLAIMIGKVVNFMASLDKQNSNFRYIKKTCFSEIDVLYIKMQAEIICILKYSINFLTDQVFDGLGILSKQLKHYSLRIVPLSLPGDRKLENKQEVIVVIVCTSVLLLATFFLILQIVCSYF